MFGVIRGDGFRLTCGEQREWMGHVCGMCLALGSTAGQVARLTTNYDAALLSVLYEALLPAPVARKTHYCPLRRGRRGEVVSPATPGARYAASISLVSAATKVQDHIADGDGWLRWRPGLFQCVSDGWARAGRRIASAVGFRTERIEAETQRQPAVEAQPDRDFAFYAQPTEQSVGAACSHVAVLAGCPEKAGLLDRIGQLFGRIMYLLDAVKDHARDLARGKFNPLARCFAPHEVRRQARQLFNEAHDEIKAKFTELAPPNPTLARRLLVDQLASAADAALGEEDLPGSADAGPKKLKRPEVHLRKREQSESKPECDCCDDMCECAPDCCTDHRDFCSWGCDIIIPNCSDAGCGDLCGGVDACSGCDISCDC